ncbi:gliding motility-associated C-terminal domain-containing protein [Pontibacter sp. JH31]|uniref:Gliding motility-associated C-terminal domain-containing protein n=1 Tax=Pontibacter aquaedesilientis TaxID=2766980 RepID=A0ABR7XHH3_9BACT|nr:gliding motility-associated C-terminal domain-containing protein [Pontibacter aquaedesilientis]MBD1397759.1 gliding motility-associated C-terminal domain-containing protein [Pontibacter aquaedesilientis]
MNKILRRNLFFCVVLYTLIGLIQAVEAQSTSNRGTNFWVGYTAHIDGTGSKMSLYLTSDVNTTATVSIPKLGISTTYAIIANTVTIAPISSAAYVGSSEMIENKGIQVVSEQPIVVYAHIYASARSAATLVLPTNTLGKEYYAASYKQDVANQFSEFMVIGTEDNTEVEITPKSTTRLGRPANVPFRVTLNKGEVYQVQSSVDLTGSKVISVSDNGPSCKKIAVFSGSSFAGIGCTNAGSKDNLYQQLYPLSTWGRNFITAPFKTRLGGDVFRVLAASDNTTVTINGSDIQLNAGQFYEFTSATANFITSDKPITLAQYARTQNCDNVTGDPEMILVNPIEQTLEDITLYSSPFFQITGHYINIVMKTADTPGFRLDGMPVTFIPVSANPVYSYAQVTVSAGNHRLTASAGFNAIAYGFGNVESYGYSAGANIKSLEQYISADQSNFCGPGTVNFKANLTYTPTSLKWYFSDNTTSTQTNPSKTFTNPGKYTASLVTTKPNNIDCESKDSTSFEIVVNPAVTADAGPDLVLCSGDKVTLGQTAVTGITYTWSPAVGLSATNIANPTFQLINTGSSNITQKLYFDAVNATTKCAARDSVVITIKPALTRDAGPDVTVCSGDKTTIGLPALSGYAYSWSPATGLSTANAAQTTVQLTNTTGKLVRHQYIRSATFNSCTVSDTVIVTVKPAPIAQAGSNKTVCSGTTVSIGSQSQANHTYEWSPATGLSSTTIANPTVTLTNTTQLPISQTYTLTATLDGCVATSQVVVTVNPLPLADAGPDVSICAGASTTLSATGGVSYLWSPAAGLSATNVAKPVASPTVTTTYTVTVTDGNGCVSTDQVVVTVNPLPTAAITVSGVTTFCAGESVTLSATDGASYKWSNGATSKSIVVSASGNYSVTVTDAKGCSATSSAVAVTVKPLPLSNAGADVTLCSGSSATLGKSAVTGYTYSWFPATGLSSATAANPTVTLSNLTAVPVSYTYKVTTTLNGCSSTDEVIVKVNPLPVVDISPDVAICAGSATVLSATGGVSYLWSPAAGLSATNVAKPVASPTATTTYTVTVTDANGCIKTDKVVVTVNPLPAARIMGSPSVCPNITGVSYQIEHPQDITFKWGVKGGQIASNANSDITVDWGETNANALVYAVPTSKLGCVGDTVKFKVVINQLLTPETPKGPELLCRQDKNDVTYKVQLTNGSVYTWNISGGRIVSGQGTNQVKVSWNDSGKGKLWINETSITATDRCFGTSDTLFFNLVPNTTSLAMTSIGTELTNEKNILVKYNIVTSDTYPADKTFDLQRKLPTDMTWATIAAVPLASNQFVDVNLQTSQSSYEYRLTGTNTCDSVLVSPVHSSILLSGKHNEGQNSNIQLQWNAYNGWSQEPVRYELWKQVDNATAYKLDQSVNSASSTVSLTLPVEGFTLCYRVRAIAGTKESWSNSICFDLENALSIPNIITPNGDGKNDRFEIINLQFYPGSQLRIFNRWGKEVYSSSDYKGDWDAANLQGGVYFYQLSTKVKAHLLKGWVEVIR